MAVFMVAFVCDANVIGAVELGELSKLQMQREPVGMGDPGPSKRRRSLKIFLRRSALL
jgi:hypothetical protein